MSGFLRNGVWHPGWYDNRTTGGEFIRQDSAFRDWVRADGSSGYPAASGRYHLYVSLACPWAHRVLIMRALKRLEGAVSVSVVEPVMGEQGWEFSATLPDHVNGFAHLHQVYTATRTDFSGRVTVPVLWDKVSGRIVNNESAEIVRMLNREFSAFTDVATDYYPAPLREAIDTLNAEVYDGVNNGVYRCGFASTQAAYEAAYDRLFATLDRLEALLSHSRYLLGDRLTEADWRLFTTLVRFDAVYYGHFKCNRQRLVEFPNLWPYLRDLVQVPGVAATVNMDHIKRHYYMSHTQLNPGRIVPKGPALDFSAAHGRARMSASRD
jgi:putative glutathione S-transferase